MLTIFTSLAGSTGVTTTAVATAVHWPRPAVLVEADIAKTSSILPGYFRGQHDHTRGLIPVSIEFQNTGKVDPSVLWANALELEGDRLVIPGFSTAMAGANSTPEFWEEMASVLTGLERSNVDAVVDMGRLAINDPRTALLAAADQIVIVSGTQLSDATAIRARLPAIRNTLARVAHSDHIALLLCTSRTEPYDPSELAAALDLPVLTRIGGDPIAAAVYSAGGVTNKHIRGRKTAKTFAALPAIIIASVTARREDVGLSPEGNTTHE
jgi:hypothetical protein